MSVKKQNLSISKIAMRYSLDRATVRKRLEDAEIKPVSESAKEKLYEVNKELEAALMAQSRPIDAAKLRKENAEAELREIKLAEAKSEMFPVAEFTAAVQSIFGNLHKKTCVHLPKTLAKRLKKAKSETEITRILEKEYAAVFNELRENYKKFLDKKLLQ
jgi:hypothetical protein